MGVAEGIKEVSFRFVHKALKPWQIQGSGSLSYQGYRSRRRRKCLLPYNTNLRRRLLSLLRSFNLHSEYVNRFPQCIIIIIIIILKVGCLHPVACTRSGSGFPSNATLFWIFYSVTATCFGRMTIFKWKYIHNIIIKLLLLLFLDMRTVRAVSLRLTQQLVPN
jgi:hypothetical protein